MATYSDTVNYLLNFLFESMPEFKGVISYSDNIKEKRRALRDLMNLKRPGPLPDSFLSSQDALLKYELSKQRIYSLRDITTTSISKVGLINGDITKMAVDAIVDPASQTLLGCFVPGHHCVDNDIHSAAGLQLRNECNEIMKKQKGDEQPGRAKITKGYNLPSKYVIHTVAPRFKDRPSKKETNELIGCYLSCLELATRMGLKSICFPAIGVGEKGFSSKSAAKIAVNVVEEFLNDNENAPVVVFCMKYELDYQAYEEILG